ncbi:hypothetical protein Tco_0827212 [Tanacetum coccineum]
MAEYSCNDGDISECLPNISDPSIIPSVVSGNVPVRYEGDSPENGPKYLTGFGLYHRLLCSCYSCNAVAFEDHSSKAGGSSPCRNNEIINEALPGW